VHTHAVISKFCSVKHVLKRYGQTTNIIIIGTMQLLVQWTWSHGLSLQQRFFFSNFELNFRGLWRYVSEYWCKDSEVISAIAVFQMMLLFQIKQTLCWALDGFPTGVLSFFSNHIASVRTHDFFFMLLNCEINWSAKVFVYACWVSTLFPLDTYANFGTILSPFIIDLSPQVIVVCLHAGCMQIFETLSRLDICTFFPLTLFASS